MAYKKKQYAYETVLKDSVQMMANYIIDKHKELQFNVPDIKLKRKDYHAIRDLILNMTPAQRKEQGINKSTLWQTKKNIQDGKKGQDIR